MISDLAKRLARRVGAAQDGVAAMEFALIVPLLFVLITGSVEAAQLVRQNMAFQNSVNTFAQTTATQSIVTGGMAGSLHDFCVGAKDMMFPYNTSSLAISIASVSRYSTSSAPTMDWEVDTSCPTRGATIGASAAVSTGTVLVPALNDSVLVAKGSYTGASYLQKFFPQTFSMSYQILVRPRTGTVTCTSC